MRDIDVGNEDLSAMPGLWNSFVQFLDAKFPFVESRHVQISKFEPLHTPHVLCGEALTERT